MEQYLRNITDPDILKFVIRNREYFIGDPEDEPEVITLKSIIKDRPSTSVVRDFMRNQAMITNQEQELFQLSDSEDSDSDY